MDYYMFRECTTSEIRGTGGTSDRAGGMEGGNEKGGKGRREGESQRWEGMKEDRGRKGGRGQGKRGREETMEKGRQKDGDLHGEKRREDSCHICSSEHEW